MKKAPAGNGSFADAVRKFVARYVAISVTLAQMREETGDDPPGNSSTQELLNDLQAQLAVAKSPRRVNVSRFAMGFSPMMDVAGETYRSAFDAVIDIAERVLAARYNDVLAPMVIDPDDLNPKTGPDGPIWNRVRESIVHQAEVRRINRRLTFAAERIEEALADGPPEPQPNEQAADLWWSRLALLGRGKPNAGPKAMWRRLSAISHSKGKTTFSYGESFATSKPVEGWSGAQRAARRRLKRTLIDGKPIMGGGRGRHVLNWRLPKWFVAQLDRDYPEGGP